ncbi:MAG: transcription termination factor NusA [Bifidobacteriaceae bacterium]|jgi:N utilization substance protein A|nr:transcription termination factor NusA [Bifidobacteriaceae bacterium]
MEIDIKVFKAVETESNIPGSTLKESIETGINDAYHRLPNHSEYSRAELNMRTGEIKIYAQEPIEFGDDGVAIRFRDLQEETPSDFSRIAAAEARRIISQRVQDARAGYVFEEYRKLKFAAISGLVQPIVDSDNIKIKLPSGFEAFLPAKEQIPGEVLSLNEYVRVFITEVERGNKGPDIVVSRTHPGLVRKLFEKEVPELSDQTVEIVSIAREAGDRTKVSVKSNDINVNPVATLIGQLGKRVRAVVEELGQEKIDIILYSDSPKEYIANALSPAKVIKVEITDDVHKIAQAIVPDDQLSLAIGKEGQNARLAAKLTGWKIDVLSESEIDR